MKSKYGVIFPLLFIAVHTIAGEEVKIGLETVPAELMDKVSKLMPEATYQSANTEEENGDLVYEIQGVLADGRKLEVDITPAGDVEEIEVEFTHDLVPGAVLNAVESAYPGFTASFIEASHSESKKVVGYEFVGQQGGEKLDLDVSADGRKIVVADD
ncbi:hypothetical protein FT643_15835 [Ketobacter sp. MCCC 1A13808]|uniref:hypothetical protein n=1 Tax=Ketobacter sp. MCCC 1A13808 TaxID=2602738 RepID=UPI0012EC7C86|nr:hypothetical protein [Ketobacter sp. MCCC 1A13808]MVF13613.1 hypothetical protein [Ketobacter sp. MCCC 1A13808]